MHSKIRNTKRMSAITILPQNNNGIESHPAIMKQEKEYEGTKMEMKK